MYYLLYEVDWRKVNPDKEILLQARCNYMQRLTGAEERQSGSERNTHRLPGA